MSRSHMVTMIPMTITATISRNGKSLAIGAIGISMKNSDDECEDVAQPGHDVEEHMPGAALETPGLHQSFDQDDRRCVSSSA